MPQIFWKCFGNNHQYFIERETPIYAESSKGDICIQNALEQFIHAQKNFVFTKVSEEKTSSHNLWIQIVLYWCNLGNFSSYIK